MTSLMLSYRISFRGPRGAPMSERYLCLTGSYMKLVSGIYAAAYHKPQCTPKKKKTNDITDRSERSSNRHKDQNCKANRENPIVQVRNRVVSITVGPTGMVFLMYLPIP